MNALKSLDLNTLEVNQRTEVQQRIDDYTLAEEKLRNVMDESQVAFDRHRLIFPDDFNFEVFLTQNNPAYHEAIFCRNQARNKLNNILKECFTGWDKDAL